MATNMIQVFCTKSIKFRHPKDSSVTHIIRNHDFTYAPSWIKDTSIFATLMREGSIKVIESAKDLASTEISGKVMAEQLKKEAYNKPAVKEVVIEETVEDEEIDDTEVTEEVEITTGQPVDLDTLTNKELFKVCQDRGIEAEPKQSKAYYLKKLNK